MSEATIVEQGLATQLEIAVNVRDRSGARRWYADKLSIHFDGNDRATINGVTLVLWGFADLTPASHAIYQFVTLNLERAHTILRERSVEVSDIDHDDWNFLFQDPDGNRFVFYSPRKWLTSGMAPYPAVQSGGASTR